MEREFLHLLDRYAEYGRRAGIPMGRSPMGARHELFSRLLPEQLANTLARLRTELSILAETEAAGDPLADPARQLWRFLSHSGLRPRADIFAKIEDGDLLQVYSFDQTLLFVSLNFFQHVSFTLEQVFCQTWRQATRRDPEVERVIGAAFARVVTGDEAETFDPGNPWHLVEEVDTELGFRYDLKVKWISPLRANERSVALLAIVGIRAPVTGAVNPA